MKTKYKLLIFFTSFGYGVVAPVLSLLLSAHGCPTGMLGVAFGAFAAVVIAAEVPSGVFADLHGRKVSFLISCALSAVSGAVLLLARSFPAAVAGLMLFGLAAAFSSGSAEALIVDETLLERGQDALGKTVASIAAYQCAGIAAGSLLGGYLPNDGAYTVHLAVRISLALACAVFAAVVLKETARGQKKQGGLLKAHLGQMVRIMKQKRALTAVFLVIFAVTVTQAMVEMYWQPGLISLSGGVAQSYLGYICAGGYVATTLGCALMGRANLKAQRRQWIAYIGLGAAFAVLVYAMAAQTGPLWFAVCYVLLYFSIGLMAVPEQTIVNTHATNDVRASVMSVVSFFSRAGALISGVVSSALLLKTQIGPMWQIGAAFTGVCLLAVGVSVIVSLEKSAASEETPAEG